MALALPLHVLWLVVVLLLRLLLVFILHSWCIHRCIFDVLHAYQISWFSNSNHFMLVMNMNSNARKDRRKKGSNKTNAKQMREILPIAMCLAMLLFATPEWAMYLENVFPFYRCNWLFGRFFFFFFRNHTEIFFQSACINLLESSTWFILQNASMKKKMYRLAAKTLLILLISYNIKAESKAVFVLFHGIFYWLWYCTFDALYDCMYKNVCLAFFSRFFIIQFSIY